LKRFGVALGGGGARGLAHVLVMESLDRLGIRPSVISGTSMGAIVGAMYASGRRGDDLRADLSEILVGKEDTLSSLFSKTPDILRLITSVTPYLKRGGFLSADKFLNYLLDEIQAETFEDLAIPFKVVTADFWTGEEVVITEGPLLPALKASMSIPGVFPPVELGGRVLVDGGVVNNVPWSVLNDCDFTLAVDVAPTRKMTVNPIPNMLDAVLGMFDIMIEKSVDQNLSDNPPSMYVKPEIVGIRTLDFDKVDTVFAQAESEIFQMEDELRLRLENLR
jgi:NTE family protein